eukprot:5916737-Prymnesium_polylepis.1
MRAISTAWSMHLVSRRTLDNGKSAWCQVAQVRPERRRVHGWARLAASLGGPPSDVFTYAFITDAETQP